ncbi:hypothetical protein Tco_0067625 [Tanacetum coccineum]
MKQNRQNQAREWEEYEKSKPKAILHSLTLDEVHLEEYDESVVISKIDNDEWWLKVVKVPWRTVGNVEVSVGDGVKDQRRR